MLSQPSSTCILVSMLAQWTLLISHLSVCTLHAYQPQLVLSGGVDFSIFLFPFYVNLDGNSNEVLATTVPFVSLMLSTVDETRNRKMYPMPFSLQEFGITGSEGLVFLWAIDLKQQNVSKCLQSHCLQWTGREVQKHVKVNGERNKWKIE